MKRTLLPLLLLVAISSAGSWLISAQAATQVQIELESAADTTGPWTKLSVNSAFQSPDGSILTSSSNSNSFFRLRIEASDQTANFPVIPIETLNPQLLSRAADHIAEFLQLGNSSHAPSEFEGWRGAVLGPHIIPVYDPTYMGGREPAAFEFKVISPPKANGDPVPFLQDSEREPEGTDRGYLLLSMNQAEAPIPSFSFSGPTPCEGILRCAPSLHGVKIVRFGPTFTALENERGELLANFGTQPFKPTRNFCGIKTNSSRESTIRTRRLRNRPTIPAARRAVGDLSFLR